MSGPSSVLAEAVAEWQAARHDVEISKAVRRLLIEGGAKAIGWCSPKDKLTIQRDAELTMFLRSVAKANAWGEERDRIRSKRKRGRQPEGTQPLPLPAIIRCLPIWRSWGRMLIEAERAPTKVSAPTTVSARESGGTSSGGARAERNDVVKDDVEDFPSAKGP